MNQIAKNTSNDCVFTLREKSQLWNLSGITPFYLFSFTSQQTNQIINFVSTNLADLTAQTRYDEFLIVETGSTHVNLSAGTINLTPAIFWDYVVYEQLSQFNFNTAKTIGVVEHGRIYVNDTVDTFNYLSYSGQTGANFITYNK